MKSADGIFEKMVDEAIESVARKGWKNATQKEVTLAGLGMLSRQIKSRMHRLTRPFWWMAGMITAGVLTYIIGNFLG